MINSVQNYGVLHAVFQLCSKVLKLLTDLEIGGSILCESFTK